VLFRGEGINSSVLILERSGQRHFYVSGKAEASTAPADMRLERMMGHIPALIHPHPRSVLTVGFGAASPRGSFVPYPDVEQLVICELEPFIPPASNEFFGPQKLPRAAGIRARGLSMTMRGISSTRRSRRSTSSRRIRFIHG
jgi:spermidine synthase